MLGATPVHVESLESVAPQLYDGRRSRCHIPPGAVGKVSHLLTTTDEAAQAIAARQAANRCQVSCLLAAKTRSRSPGCACARAPLSTPRHSHNERHECSGCAVGARVAAHDPQAG